LRVDRPFLCAKWSLLREIMYCPPGKCNRAITFENFTQQRHVGPCDRPAEDVCRAGSCKGNINTLKRALYTHKRTLHALKRAPHAKEPEDVCRAGCRKGDKRAIDTLKISLYILKRALYTPQKKPHTLQRTLY